MRVAFSQCRTDLRATVFIAEPAASLEDSFTRDESASVYLSARSGRMAAYRKVDQKSGVALSAFSLFNTWRFVATNRLRVPTLRC
jgi:hypothetical protein